MITARSIAKGSFGASPATPDHNHDNPHHRETAVHRSDHVTPPSLRKLPPDYYGQSHPIESDQLICEGLDLLEEELSKLGNDGRNRADTVCTSSNKHTKDTTHEESSEESCLLDGIKLALRECPRYVESRDHRLLFLRCEMYNCDLAAKRMAKYWNRRTALFEDDSFSSDLTLDRALRDDGNTLHVGFMRLLPGTDGAGRSIMMVEASRLDSTTYSRDSMVRAVWYMMHAALESETAQQHGIIALVNMKDVSVRQFDKELISKIADSLKGCLPVRLSAIHICHPPVVFAMIFPLIKLLLGPRLRKRIRLYSRRNALSELEAFGLSSDTVPTELGGNVVLDHDAWLDQRKRSGK